MKKFFSAILASSFLFMSTPDVSSATQQVTQKNSQVTAITENLRFPESVYPYNGGLLISNFGSENFSPRDDENKGYIIFWKDGKTETIIPADGRLHAPTAMVVKDNFLFVCDLNCIKIFDLNKKNSPCQVVPFPETEKVVNAMTLSGNTLYVTMTNPGHVYRLDVKNPAQMSGKQPEQWLEILGANGIAIRGKKMFVVSIPTDYKTVAAENVIYQVENIRRPVAKKFDEIALLYDGVDISSDGKKLYVSDWKTASLTEIDIKTKTRRIIFQETGIGPADLAVADGIVYLPDMLGSRILMIPVQ